MQSFSNRYPTLAGMTLASKLESNKYKSGVPKRESSHSDGYRLRFNCYNNKINSNDFAIKGQTELMDIYNRSPPSQVVNHL